MLSIAQTGMLLLMAKVKKRRGRGRGTGNDRQKIGLIQTVIYLDPEERRAYQRAAVSGLGGGAAGAAGAPGAAAA
jgi:hypothetical protein